MCANLSLTASQEHCQRVWQSYGVACEVLAWFDRSQVTQLQQLNRFWYTKAVSRVEPRFSVARPPLLFTIQGDYSRRHKLYLLDPSSMRLSERSDQTIFNFYDYFTVQVKRDLYALRDTYERSEWVCYQNLASNDLKKSDKIVKPAILTPRERPALANYKDKIIFVAGGYRHGRTLACVECYTIAHDTWSAVQPLNQERQSASACSLGYRVYVFGGYISDQDHLNSIEWLNVHQLDESAAWTKIKPRKRWVKPRKESVFVPISATEIVILGGSIIRETSEANLYDTSDDTFTPLPWTSQVKFTCEDNGQSHFVNTGTIAMVVRHGGKKEPVLF